MIGNQVETMTLSFGNISFYRKFVRERWLLHHTVFYTLSCVCWSRAYASHSADHARCRASCCTCTSAASALLRRDGTATGTMERRMFRSAVVQRIYRNLGKRTDSRYNSAFCTRRRCSIRTNVTRNRTSHVERTKRGDAIRRRNPRTDATRCDENLVVAPWYS